MPDSLGKVPSEAKGWRSTVERVDVCIHKISEYKYAYIYVGCIIVRQASSLF
jgi:hypothetical protein